MVVDKHRRQASVGILYRFDTARCVLLPRGRVLSFPRRSFGTAFVLCVWYSLNTARPNIRITTGLLSVCGRANINTRGRFVLFRALCVLSAFLVSGASSVFVCVASTRRAYVIAPPSGLVVFSPQKRVFPPRKRGLFPQKRAFLQLKRAFLLQKLFRRVEAFPRVHVRTAGGVVDYKQRRRGVSFGRVVSTDARALWSLPSSVRLIWLSIRYQVVTVWCTIW